MRAVILTEYGGPEALQVVDRPELTPGAGQVVVRMHATSCNPIDLKLASGVMKAAVPLNFPSVPGGDVSGVVEAVGEGVSDLAVGDAVYGYSSAGGAYAERIAVAASALTRKPANLGFADAAALALVGQTATQAVRGTGVARDNTLVVIGAGGAVGSVAVQVALSLGVRVIGVATARDIERVKALGAEQVLERGFPAGDTPRNADGVVDTVGGDAQVAALSMLRKGGVLVSLNRPPPAEEAERVGVRAVLVRTETTRAGLDELRGRIEAGVVRPFIGSRYSLDEVPAMWRDVAARSHSGKPVVDILAG